MIRVLLVEDQTLVREGLETLLGLSSDIRVVDRAADGAEALKKLESLRVLSNASSLDGSPGPAPDVVLLDVRMPQMSGLEFLQAVRTSGTVLPPTILLTTFDDDAALLDGIRLGARGYLLKDVSLATLTEAIRLVAGGGTMISPVVTERLLRGWSQGPRWATPAAETGEKPLTTRETEILRLMTGGYSNHEIAAALVLSDGTVKNHVSNILGKLQVRDRTRAVLKAIEQGYV
jgi:DNA-binding NarL/FixJ family response regulator